MSAPGKWEAQHSQAEDLYPNSVYGWYHKGSGEGMVVIDEDDEYSIWLLDDAGDKKQRVDTYYDFKNKEEARKRATASMDTYIEPESVSKNKKAFDDASSGNNVMCDSCGYENENSEIYKSGDECPHCDSGHLREGNGGN